MTDGGILIGRLVLRPGRDLRCNQTQIAIGNRALAVLSALAEAEGKVLSKEDLFAKVWQAAIVEDNSLQAQISAVRRALGSEAHRLVTVHGRGYRLDCAGSRNGRHELDGLRAKMAVIPLHNRSPDLANGYLCAGMTDEIRHILHRHSGLSVLGRSSTEGYAGTEPDAARVRSDLSADAMLTGSLRVAGGSVRAVIEISDCAAERVIWSQSFDGTLDAILELQQAVALAVLVALRRKLNDSGDSSVVHFRQTSVAAFRLVSEASWLAGKGSAQNFITAITLCRQAVALQPDSAFTLAALASYIALGVVFWLPHRHWIEESDSLAARAATIDPHEPSAQWVLAVNCTVRGKRVDAERHFAAAIALDPHEAYYRLGHAALMLLEAGHHRLALEALSNIRSLAPFHPNAAALLAVVHLAVGNDADAATQIELAQRFGLSTDNPLLPGTLAMLALRRGDYPAAVKYSLATLGGTPPPLGLTDGIVAALKEPALRPAALAAIRAVIAKRDASMDLSSRRWLILWLALLDNIAGAFDMIDELLDELERLGGTGAGYSFMWIPELTALRKHPRFADLARRLGLLDYWAEYGPPDEGYLAGQNHP